MKKKRLDRDLWGFGHFPYFQMRVDTEKFHGLACLIKLTDGDYYYWDLPIAGKAAVCGEGMTWLQLIPDGKNHLITVKYLADGKISVWYVDITDGYEYASDGVIVYTDMYLDVIFTPEGDLKVDDRDELDAAYCAGELSRDQYESAIAESGDVIREFCADLCATEKFCNEIRAIVEERAAKGEGGIKLNHKT